MTMRGKELHWSAIVGVACSFWGLFWLICITSALYEMANGSTGLTPFLIVSGLLLLWAAYRAMKRLDLLKNGELGTAKIVQRADETYDQLSGATNKVNYTSYRYRVGNNNYTNQLVWSFGLKRGQAVPIVYHTVRPAYSKMISRFPAHYDVSAKHWRSSMSHVIPRLALLGFSIIGFVAILFILA